MRRKGRAAAGGGGKAGSKEAVQTGIHRSARAVVGPDRFFGQVLLIACLPHGKSGADYTPVYWGARMGHGADSSQ